MLTEKQIVKIAVKFRNSMAEYSSNSKLKKQLSLLTILNDVNSEYSGLREFVNRIYFGHIIKVTRDTGRVRLSIGDSEAPFFSLKLCDDTMGLVKAHEYIIRQRIIKTVDTLSSNLLYVKSLFENTLQPTYSIPSLPAIIEEIRAINSNWPDVSFRNNKLCIKITKVVLTDENESVSLGDFNMVFDIHKGLTVESIDQITSKDGAIHPHINDSKELCTGDGQDAMSMALDQGRLEDYFRIVESIVRTYNDDSPYTKLREWYDPDHDGEVYCESCGEWESEDNFISCHECDLIICQACSSDGGGSCNCGHWMCDSCLTVCEGCSTALCGHCGVRCPDCGNMYCEECIKECDCCGENCCKSCLESCQSCDKEVCVDCRLSCPNCGDTVCTECMTEDNKCSVCEEIVCNSCLTKCDECRKVVCNSCLHKCCDDCGRNLCEDCETEKCMFVEKIING